MANTTTATCLPLCQVWKWLAGCGPSKSVASRRFVAPSAERLADGIRPVREVVVLRFSELAGCLECDRLFAGPDGTTV